jgi:hypothetical protein
MMRAVSNAVAWACIVLGVTTMTLAIQGALTATWHPALGVLFIVVGLNGFATMRLARLEKMMEDARSSRRGIGVSRG